MSLAQKLKSFRWLWMTSLAAGIFFLCGMLVTTQLPKLRSFMLVKIEELSRDQLPVFVLPESLEVKLFPLGASLKNVKIMPKTDLQSIIDPFTIESAEATVSIWQLIQGRLKVTSVKIEGANLKVRPPPPKKKTGPPLAGFFEKLAQFPVEKIELQQIGLTIRSVSPKFELDAGEINLLAERQSSNAISLDLDAPGLLFHDPETKALVRIDLNANIYAAKDIVTLEGLKIRRGDSYIVASGELNGNTEALKFPDARLKTRGEISLESTRNWIVGTFKGFEEFPKMKGRAFFDASIEQKNGKNPRADFKLKSSQLKIDHFFLDQVETEGRFSGNEIKIPKLTVDNDSGHIDISDVAVSLESPFNFSWKTKIPKLSLYELLHNVDAGKVPVWLKLAGEMPCAGHARPDFEFTCKGKATGRNLLVKDELNAKSTIVAVKELDADGEFTVGEHQASYRAEIKAPHSQGRSDGVIIYKQGFNINYEADSLSMSDISNLADLKIDGQAHIKGSTQGDSHAATLAMNIDGQNVWFENFGLGAPKTDMSYKTGMLDFKNLQGHFTVSRYAGDVQVNLHKKTIDVNGRMPFLNSADLLDAFSRKFRLPVELTGTGQAQIKVSGPFEFTKLSYELKSSLFRGAVAGEAFDQIHFDVHAHNGEVVTDRAQLSKGNSTITLTGVGHPDGKIKSSITARSLPIEETHFVASSGLAISGQLDFDMSLSGPVLAPDAIMRAHFGKSSIADIAMMDSNIHLKFNKQTVEGGGSVFGDAIKTEFVFPYDKAAPYSLRIYANNWDYTPLFSAFAGPGGRRDYEGHLSSRIELASSHGGFWNATGLIGLDDFSLSRGALSMKSNGPVNLTMKNGVVRVGKFELLGENSFFRLSNGSTSANSAATKLDLQVNGKFDLSLFSMLTPFFEEMRGLVNVAFNIHAGPNLAAEVLGSAYLDKGYLKFFDFQHPFEDLKIDLLFNQKRILFNSIRSEFGGGRVNASGTMEFHAHHDLPVNVSGSFEKITLNVPEKLKTSGDGDFSVTGNWFPFLLKARYDVTQGLLTKDFNGDNGPKSDSVRRSYFLPQVLLKENFTALLLDLSVDFSRGIEIKNDLADGKFLGNLHILGPPGRPSIDGVITADKEAKLLFRDNVFDITTLNVQFLGTPDLNPKLYVAANTRVQEHDISLVVQGTAQKPLFNWSSIPVLAEKDVITLLALGTTDQKLDNGIVNSQQQSASTGSNIATGILAANPLGKEIKNRFGVNLQFSSGFDDATNSAVQKIIVSRKISKKMDVQASRAIGKVGETEAKVRYRLSDKVSLVGSYLGRQSDEAFPDPTSTVGATTSVPGVNRLGLDVEYKIEFK